MSKKHKAEAGGGVLVDEQSGAHGDRQRHHEGDDGDDHRAVDQGGDAEVGRRPIGVPLEGGEELEPADLEGRLSLEQEEQHHQAEDGQHTGRRRGGHEPEDPVAGRQRGRDLTRFGQRPRRFDQEVDV